MKKSLIAAFMLVIAGKTFAATSADTLTVTTQPQMHCANCEKKIKSNIRFVKGTEENQNFSGRPEGHHRLRRTQSQVRRLR